MLAIGTEFGASADRVGIAARAGLGERERRHLTAGRQVGQVFLLLVGRACQEDTLVADRLEDEEIRESLAKSQKPDERQQRW